MNPLKQLLILAAVLGLSACSSTPTSRYYVLQPGQLKAEKTLNDSIGIGPVQVADYLDRSQLSSIDNRSQLKLAEFDRWGEPLTAGITRTLLENIANLTNNQKLVGFPWRRDESPRYAIRIHILKLDSINSSAILKVKWLIRDNQNQTMIAEGLDTFTTALETGYANQVNGYSHLLAQLSQKLVRELP
jgi:uncharacterized lipoprotein YmbA